MITAVADTNIYISALLFGGPCEAILGLARAGLLDLYDSPAIERELRRVLHEKFHWTDRQVRDAVLELRLMTTRIHPTCTSPVWYRMRTTIASWNAPPRRAWTI